MTGPAPKSADLIAADPTTALPWEFVREGRNLVADPRCTVTARTDTMDVVLEGTATQVTSQDTLHMVAEAYRPNG